MIKLCAALLLLVPWGCASGPLASEPTAHTQLAAQQAVALIHGNPESLIRHCGRPDHVEDSVFVQQAGGISSRTLSYNKAHLRITYIDSGQGDQQWDFSSLVDTESNHALAAGDLQSFLEKRLPCAVRTNNDVAQSAESTQRSGRTARQRAGKAAPDS